MFILDYIDYIFLSIFWLIIFFLAFKAFKAIKGQSRKMFAVYSILILLLLWAGLNIGVTPGSRAYTDYKITRDLFGTGIILGQPELEYNTERSFHGDGYSIEVHTLNDGEVNKILRMFSQKIQGLPIRFSYRSHWQQTFWRQTPIKPEDEQFLEFALMEHASDAGLKESHKLLRNL